jgi:RHS repeat-associated protein
MLMTDETGTTVWEGEYLPFGETLSLTGTVTNNLRFPGQYFDTETGLHYNYFRDYKPEIGRYVEADPIGLVGGINLFVYVGNNSINALDPRGLYIWLCNRQVRMFPYIGNHAYLWNDKTGQCCGRNKGSNPMYSCQELGPGPGGHSCVKVEGSNGLENEIMACCLHSANDGKWRLYVNDCHNSVERCLAASGLSNPGAPGDRLGECDSCWIKPNDDP